VKAASIIRIWRTLLEDFRRVDALYINGPGPTVGREVRTDLDRQYDVAAIDTLAKRLMHAHHDLYW
jgi:hypothetical protein